MNTTQDAVTRGSLPNFTATTALVLQVGGSDLAADVSAVLQAAAISSLALLASTINALALVVFLRKPSLRSTSNRFVMSLVLGNLLTAATLLPSAAVRVRPARAKQQTSAWRQGWAAVATLAVSASVLSVLGIALDRHSAVLAPLRYSAHGTRQRARLLLAAVWGLAALQAAVPPILGLEPPSLLLSPPREALLSPAVFRLAYSATLLALGLALPLLALCLIYSQMYSAARGNSERTRRHSIGGEMGGKSLTRQSSVFSREEGRAVKTAALVILSFLVCWTPYFVTLVVAPALDPLRFLALCGALSNGVITPFVYVFRGEAVRHEATQLLCWWRPVDPKSPAAPGTPGAVPPAPRIRPPPLGYFEAASTEQESLSVHSFTTECRHCGALNAADFVATYEVVRPEPVAPLASAEPSTPDTKTPEARPAMPRRAESVTFRVALFPRGVSSRRCASCVRQNSDSSCGSGAALLRRDSSREDSNPNTPKRRPRSDPELELQMTTHRPRAKMSTLAVTHQETSLTSSGLGRSLESLELNPESPPDPEEARSQRPKLQRLPAIDDEEYFV